MKLDILKVAQFNAFAENRDNINTPGEKMFEAYKELWSIAKDVFTKIEEIETLYTKGFQVNELPNIGFSSEDLLDEVRKIEKTIKTISEEDFVRRNAKPRVVGGYITMIETCNVSVHATYEIPKDDIDSLKELTELYNELEEGNINHNELEKELRRMVREKGWCWDSYEVDSWGENSIDDYYDHGFDLDEKWNGQWGDEDEQEEE